MTFPPMPISYRLRKEGVESRLQAWAFDFLDSFLDPSTGYCTVKLVLALMVEAAAGVVLVPLVAYCTW